MAPICQAAKCMKQGHYRGVLGQRLCARHRDIEAQHPVSPSPMDVSGVPDDSRAWGEVKLGSSRCGQLHSAGGHAANPATLHVLSCHNQEAKGRALRQRYVDGDWLTYMRQVPVPTLVARKQPNVPTYSAGFKIRAAVVPGTGKLLVMGQVQEDFFKSAQVALACLRSQWDTVELLLLQGKTPAERVTMRHTAFRNDVHLMPMTVDQRTGGGSAGVGIALTLLWLYTGLPFRQDTAVTGALTLGGKVLRVGGVDEKRVVAAAVGMSRLIVPKANRDEQAAAEDAKQQGEGCKKRKRLSEEEKAAAGVALIGVETLWEAARACLQAPDNPLLPVPAQLPAPRSYSRVLTVVGSQPLVIECSFVAPSSDGGGATLLSGLTESGVNTLKMVCGLILGNLTMLTIVLGDQAEFDLLHWHWDIGDVPKGLMVSCSGNPDIDTALVAPAMMLAVVALLRGSVRQLPEGTAVSPGIVFTGTAYSHHPSKAEVLAALAEARPVMQAEGIRRWVQLPPGSDSEEPPLSQQALVAARWRQDQVVLSPRTDMVSFIAKAYGLQA